MDSRDIIQEPKEIDNHEILNEIFNLQRGLIDEYKKIEMMPDYPLNLNDKTSQVWLKDFTGRVVEELAEGYEAFKLVADLTDANQLWFGSEPSEEYLEMINHLQNANEEQADAMHFLVELLVFAGINPKSINDFCDAWFDKHQRKLACDVKQIKKQPTTSKCALIGRHILGESNTIAEPLAKANLLKHSIDGKVYGIDTRLLSAGSNYNATDYIEMKLMLWDITQALNISRNYLKNKPWKQTQMMTNEVLYKRELVLAFILFIGYMDAIGVGSQNLYYLYFKKNQVNHFRIKSKY